MSIFEWILNCTLLGWVLTRNLGTRPVTRQTFAIPLLVVAVAAGAYLQHVPTAGNDVPMEIAGAGLGVILGLLASATTRLHRTERGDTVATAGVAFAAVWVLAIGGRIAFAELATHSASAAVARFSMAHEITGAAAWRTTFVMMALAMVVTRVVAVAARASRGTRPATANLVPAHA